MAQVRDFSERRSGPVDSFPLINVQVGDVVGFKSDIEQTGLVTRIEGDWLVLECKSGFRGEYIGGMRVTREYAEDCWKA